jgi:mono/diheme cytochrome c family protein
MKPALSLCVLVAAVASGWGVVCTAAAPTPTAAGRADVYGRETLPAIRDWETILAAWEKETPAAERALAFPVPTDGSSVTWPNPIPLPLLPAAERGYQVDLRSTADGITVQRHGAAGAAAPERTEAGKPVLGYHHPGGGAKDHWYHRYDRRFDALGTFTPLPAPLTLQLPSPLDLRRGRNELSLTLRNVGSTALPITLTLVLHTVGQRLPCGEAQATLTPGGEQTLRLPVRLEAPGGGMLLLQLRAGDAVFRLALLTHVERADTVCDSLDQILADTPDPEAAAALADLRRESAAWRAETADAGSRWRALFETASAWREELLLRQLDLPALLFVKRQPFDSEQPYMDAHHLRNPPGGSICRLSPVRPDGTVTPVVDTLGEGIYRDLSLHWDATRLLFAFGNGSDLWDGSQSYHVFEAAVDGGPPRQLTTGPKNDCEPFYLPNGQIGFTSDRPEHFVMCGAARHVANLHVMNADGSDPRQLSFNVFNDFNPSVLPDGRILYSRWEYNERSVTSLHNPFTLFPDGTMMSPYYGNATIRPNVVMFPRAVPGSTQVMALFTAHHGQTHGPIGLIDRRRGVDGPEAITMLTPQVPTTGEKAEDSRHGWYSDPQPLSETLYLCSYTPTVVPWLASSWALYVGDRHGNLALVYRDPTISCAEPVPLRTRPPPHQLPPAAPDSAADNAEARLGVQDVYVGLPGVPRGTARYLRLIEDVPRKGVHAGGVVCTSGTGIYTVKRILGTVPLDPDGSAYFTVPANRNVYLEVLDEDHAEIQRMRSVVCLKPGEARTCVGCHESRLSAPPVRPATALRRTPSQPTPPPWGAAVTFSFLRDVQPLLNTHCSRCHTHDRSANTVILTDDLTDRFAVAYEELLPYLKVANAMRWDHPDDVNPQPPYTYGSRASPLSVLLAKGHHGVTLNREEQQRLAIWIDANAVYYDRYESAYGDGRSLFGDATGKALRTVHARRCASCHGDGDGQASTWWLSLNRHDLASSRALSAPLAPAAGGWGRCDGTVFADRTDPDYQALLAALTTVRDRLTAQPREDLLSIQGTDAATQAVVPPPPPPPRPAPPAETGAADWVYLNELEWVSGSAGWTANQDGIPRRNCDVEGKALRLGGRNYTKGIGTHAPSEIVWRLEARYDRFYALVGGAEDGGSVIVQVFADDRCLFDSGVLQGQRQVKTIDVPLDRAQTLRLVVTDAGDGITADMVNWAMARLHQRPPPQP